MAATRTVKKPAQTRRPPATTPEARENRLISLAADLAEQQLKDGTAAAQTITHFLKLGSSREKLEQQKLEHENELLQARSEALASAARVEELYTEAIKAMRTYQGSPSENHEEYED